MAQRAEPGFANRGPGSLLALHDPPSTDIILEDVEIIWLGQL